MVDATRRPLKIPQKYLDYLDRHRVHHLIERMYEELLTSAPADPLRFLVGFLTRESQNPEVPKVFIRSRSQGEEMDLAMMVALESRAVILPRHETVFEVTASSPDLKQQLQDNGGRMAPQLLAKIIAKRIKEEDCVNNGWILTGVPDSRAETVQLQMAGVLAHHAVLLAERGVARPPPALYQPPLDEAALYARRVRTMITDCGPAARVFSTTGDVEDIRDEVLEFLRSRGRESAPLILRVLLIGLPGSGRGTQAASIAANHSLVLVNCDTLIWEAMKNRTEEGVAMEKYMEDGNELPEELVTSVVTKRLSAEDCCRHGWVMFGFPHTSFQAELLMETDVFPNRVILLDVPLEVGVARLTCRRFEPASGQVLTLTDQFSVPADVASRLRRHPDDEPRRLAVLADIRRAQLRGVIGMLEHQLQTVDGTGTEDQVAETIEKIIVFQTPKTAQ